MISQVVAQLHGWVHMSLNLQCRMLFTWVFDFSSLIYLDHVDASVKLSYVGKISWDTLTIIK